MFNSVSSPVQHLIETAIVHRKICARVCQHLLPVLPAFPSVPDLTEDDLVVLKQFSSVIGKDFQKRTLGWFIKS